MAFSTRLLSSLKNLLRAGAVKNDAPNNLFYIEFNSHKAEVEYVEYDDFYDLTNTRIPDELQGHGLGSILAEKIFDHVIKTDKKMKLTCEFLDAFYKKNLDKYSNYVVEE